VDNLLVKLLFLYSVILVASIPKDIPINLTKS